MATLKCVLALFEHREITAVTIPGGLRDLAGKHLLQAVDKSRSDDAFSFFALAHFRDNMRADYCSLDPDR